MNDRPPVRQTLAHDAMATTFHLTVAHPDPLYARQAIAEAFTCLDRLESLLSRFLEGSDIFRINRLASGSTTPIHPDTFDCLTIALEVQHDTAGAFDLAYASPPSPDHRPAFELDHAAHAVRARREPLRLDLGGIAKGFALDRMAALLNDWDITSALLCASSSTILALNPPPDQPAWPVSIGPDRKPLRLALANAAFSASGLAVKGNHIIDPRTRQPAQTWSRCWSAAPSAALADALSTAYMAMSEHEIRRYCAAHPHASAYALPSRSTDLIIIADRVGPHAP